MLNLNIDLLLVFIRNSNASWFVGNGTVWEFKIGLTDGLKFLNSKSTSPGSLVVQDVREAIEGVRICRPISEIEDVSKDEQHL